MWLMLKHSLKSVIRTPGKSLLFMLLLSASILFVSIGSNMLFSAERMLEQADDQFSTVVALKYGGLHNNEGAWADQTFQDNISNLDFSIITDHPAVLAVDNEREVLAFAEEVAIKQRRSPFFNISAFTFTPQYQREDDIWTALIQEIYFGDIIESPVLFQVNPLNSEGETINRTLEEGRTYFGAASIHFAHSSRIATFIQPANLTNAHQEALRTLPPIVDITDMPDYFNSVEGNLWRNLIESMDVIDDSFSVNVSSYLPAAVPFHQNQTWLTDGQFEIDNQYRNMDLDTCYISDRLASLLGLKVGDVWPLKFHYNPSGNPEYSYWVENGFSYEGDMRIAGIFKEVAGLAFNIYIPDQNWIDKAPDQYNFLRILINNRSVDAYTEYLESVLPENIEVQVEDQGYSSAIDPILTLRKRAAALTGVSVAAGVAVSALFSYLFIYRQHETAQFMMVMGTGRTRTSAYLLFGILTIALLSSILGTLLAGAIDLRVTQIIWDVLQQQPILDLRYSERALGIPVSFTPEIATAAWVRWLSAGLLILVVFIITIVFTFQALRKPKRKKIKESIKPDHKAHTGASFRFIPTVSLRFALRSISRNRLLSLIVPSTTLLLAILISLLGMTAYQQEAEGEAIYDEVETTAYLTSFLANNRQVPLYLQSDIFPFLDPEYDSRNLGQMVYRKMNGDQITELKRTLEDENPFVKNILLTTEMHYTYMGIVNKADGRRVNLDLPRRPAVVYHSRVYGYDWFYAEVAQMPTILFTDSVLASPEFSKTKNPQFTWLEGYSDISFLSHEYIVVLPDRFADKNQINLGDKIRIASYKTIDGSGVLMEAYDFRVVGTYNQGSRSPVIYTPWSLICYIPITYDINYLDLESPNANPQPEWLVSNEYLADDINTATIILEDPRDLPDFRDYLESQDYSEVGKINRNRLAVVIEDKTLADAVESIQQHISFMNLVIVIMQVLSGIIGFILSYLLTRNRVHEFAIMRSLGTRKLQVYGAFFIEQFMLFLLGLLPILVMLYLNPGWASIIGKYLLWFIVLYTSGTIIAIGLMGRTKILDILFTKE